jgi:hypothetical protein
MELLDSALVASFMEKFPEGSPTKVRLFGTFL